MTKLIHRFRGLLIALTALALSAGLAFGAQPDASQWGLSNAAANAGKTVPVRATGSENAADEDADEDVDETTEETTDETTEEAELDSADNCTTDPTALTAEELAAMRHGSIVCWAAQQTEWPEWFAHHGAFVKCWAHQGKADAPSCTEAPAEGAAAATHGKGKDKQHKHQQ